MERATPATNVFSRLLGRLGLRYPWLVLFFAVLTIVDLAVPDPIPVVDELLLALLTGLLATFRQRHPPGDDRASSPTR